MKTKLTILTILALFATRTISQVTYQKSFGGSGAFEYGYAGQVTSDGGFITGGCTFSYGSGGCHKYVVKLDAGGNESWSMVYSANQTEVINDLCITSDDGFVICGYSYAGGTDTNRACIIRTNSIGDTIWTKFWPHADAYAIYQSSDGNILAAGLTTDVPCDAFLIKLDKNTGDTLWTRIWRGSQQDWFYGIEETNDGGIILAGFTSSYGAGQDDILLMKTDANGNVLWEKTYGTAGKEEAYGHCVQQTTDGGFIISACSSTDSTVCLIKTDAAGNMLWQKNYFAPNSYYSSSHGVEQTTDKGYIICGWKLKYPSGDEVPFIIKTDSLGNIKWSKFYGGSGNDVLYAVKQTSDGGFIACGRDYSFEPNGDVYLVKTDSNGNSGCNERDTVFSIINKTYLTNNINLPLHYGKQTTNTQTSVSSGYSEIPLCYYVGINQIENVNYAVCIFPNPFNNETIIKISSPEKIANAELKIFDVLGNEVSEILGINSKEIIVRRSNLSAGIYFYQLNNNFKNIASGKLMVE